MSTDQTQPSSPAPQPAKPKKKRRLLKVVLFLFVLLIAAVLLAPTIVSTGPGTNFVLGFVNRSIPGKVEVGDLSVGWFSGTKVENLRVLDPDGNTIMLADVDAPDVQLLAVVRGDMALGNVTVVAEKCDIVQYEDGSTNLDRAFGPSKEKEKKPTTVPENLSGKFKLTAPKVTYTAAGSEPAIVSDLVVTADIDSPQSIAAAIKAGVKQGQYSGDIDGTAKLTDAFDSGGVMQVKNASVDATFAFNKLPTQMVGALAKQGDKITLLAGPDLTTKVTAKGKLTDLLAELSITGERMKVNTTATIALSDDMKLKSLTPKPGQLAWVKMTPAAHAAWAPNAGKLLEPFEITVTQENVALVNGANNKPDMLATTAALNVEVTPIRINTGTAQNPEIKELDIRQMIVAYDGPRGIATATIEAIARQGDKSGVLLVKFDATKPFDRDGNVSVEALNLKGDVKDFALGVIDDLAGTKGLVTGVLGEVLNATTHIALKPGDDGKRIDGTWSLIANSNDNRFTANLSDGVISATTVEKRDGTSKLKLFAKLNKPGVIEVAWSQQTLNLMAERYEGLKAVAQKVRTPESRIKLTIDKLAAPLDETMMRTTEAAATLAIGPITTDLNQPGQDDANLRVTLRDTVATLNYNGPANKLSATLTAAADAAGKTGSIKANADVAGLFDAAGKLDAKALAPNITVAITDLPSAIMDSFIGNGRMAHYGIGPTLNATVITTVTQVQGRDGKTGIAGPVKITAKADNLDVLIDARLADGRVTLPDPSKSYVNLTLTSALVEELTKEEPPKATATPAAPATPPAEKTTIALAAPSKVSMVFTQLDIPLDIELMKKNGRIGFTATVDQLIPKGDARLADAAVRNLVATLAPTTLDQPLKITIKGDLLQGVAKGLLDVNATITRAMEDSRKVEARVALTDTPSSLADALTGQGGLLVDLFGPSIQSIVLTLNQGEGKTMAVSYDVKSHFASGTGSATLLTGERATLAPNSALRVNLTPQGWAAIQRKYPEKLPAALKEAILLEPTVVDVVFERGEFALAPLPEPPQAKPASAGASRSATATAQPTVPGTPAEAKTESTPLPIKAAGSNFKINITTKGPFLGKADFNEALRLDNVKAVVQTPKDFNEVAIVLDAETLVLPVVNGVPRSVTAETPRGTVHADILAKNLADKDGRVTFANLNLQNVAIDATAKNIPVSTASKVLNLGDKLRILGDTVDTLALKSRAGGDVVARLVSPNADVNATGLFTDQVRLTENAVGKFNANEVFSKALFEPLTGGLLAVEKSEKPVVITVGKDGFALPVSDFDISKMSAKVDFDFNSMKLKPLISVNNLIPAGLQPIMAAAGVGGLLESELGGFLGKFDKYMPTFGPFSATIDKGILKYDKPMTFTFEKYTVALDGTVDLRTKVPRMSFGFPKSALSAKLQRFMGAEGYLFVPFTQKDGKLVADSSAFGEILKQSFNPAKLLGGADGGKPDVGGLIGDLIGGKKNDDKKTPPRTPTPNPNDPKTPPQPAQPAPTTPTPPVPDKPPTVTDLIGDLINKNKDKDKKEPPKTTPVPTPPTTTAPTPVTPDKPTPPQPAKTVDASKLPGLNDAGRKMFTELTALEADRTKFVAKVDALAASGDVQSLYALTHAAITLSPQGAFKAGKVDLKEPKWAAYAKMKKIVDSSGFGDLGSAYVKALAEEGNADKEAAALVQWIREREAKLKFVKNQWVVTR